MLRCLRMSPMMFGSVLAGRLFTGCALIWVGRFIRLRESLPIARLIRGCDLYRSARLELILTVNNDLFSFLQPAIDQRLSSVNLCDLYRAHFGSLILSNYVGVGSVRPALYHGGGH